MARPHGLPGREITDPKARARLERLIDRLDHKIALDRELAKDDGTDADDDER